MKSSVAPNRCIKLGRADDRVDDAVYVALAEALRTVLLTGDRKLAGAPDANVVIELI